MIGCIHLGKTNNLWSVILIISHFCTKGSLGGKEEGNLHKPTNFYSIIKLVGRSLGPHLPQGTFTKKGSPFTLWKIFFENWKLGSMAALYICEIFSSIFFLFTVALSPRENKQKQIPKQEMCK